MQPGNRDATTLRWGVGAAVVGAVAGVAAAATGAVSEAAFWFAVLVAAWAVGTVVVLLQSRPSLAFFALQAWMALNVLNGAVVAMSESATVTGRVRPATPRVVALTALRHLGMTHRVSGLIRWHGIRLWLRRLPVQPRTSTDPTPEVVR